MPISFCGTNKFKKYLSEKFKKAKRLIEQAIKVDPEIQEYKSLLKSIESQM